MAQAAIYSGRFPLYLPALVGSVEDYSRLVVVFYRRIFKLLDRNSILVTRSELGYSGQSVATLLRTSRGILDSATDSRV